jgi:hypothetical protein
MSETTLNAGKPNKLTGGASASVETKSSPVHNLDTVGHDGNLVQTGLAVEQHDVIVIHVAFYHVPDS